ncbi:predicted protein [Candida tropicalis MYA-3404]|uniref:Uncharacterized protein n=1 Tax=Candida tropicalis (strain ATCC MYA-3404 / T1) TaxID=294747 RepID=C5M2W7_CANTT|nr:predicted protein [Candida tropicalis MYA-3404]EER35667.1 predicted protein [Candida tropicalis MYA-3404]KAG4409774.1 hypothetical protein JTP64_000412 [Candida tropicalis]
MIHTPPYWKTTPLMSKPLKVMLPNCHGTPDFKKPSSVSPQVSLSPKPPNSSKLSKPLSLSNSLPNSLSVLLQLLNLLSLLNSLSLPVQLLNSLSPPVQLLNSHLLPLSLSLSKVPPPVKLSSLKLTVFLLQLVSLWVLWLLPCSKLCKLCEKTSYKSLKTKDVIRHKTIPFEFTFNAPRFGFY